MLRVVLPLKHGAGASYRGKKDKSEILEDGTGVLGKRHVDDSMGMNTD